MENDLFELDIPLEDLTGYHLIEVEQNLLKAGIAVLMPDYSKAYLIRVAAYAAKIPVEVLIGLSACDFTTVTNGVQSFLMGSDSGIKEKRSNQESEKTQDLAPETSSVA